MEHRPIIYFQLHLKKIVMDIFRPYFATVTVHIKLEVGKCHIRSKNKQKKKKLKKPF